MKNIITLLNLENDVDVDNAAIFRGKMTPRNMAHLRNRKHPKKKHRNLKRGDSKHRREVLKRGIYNRKSQFGQAGHSSWWD